MSVEHTQLSQQPTTADLFDWLGRFQGPPEQFLLHLLAVQCRVASAKGGAILRATPAGSVEILSMYPQLPQDAAAPVWLAQSVELAPEVLSGGKTAVKPLHSADSLYGQPAREHLIMVPLGGQGNIRGLASFIVASADEAALAASRERLELTISLLSLYEMRLTLQRRQLDFQRLRMSMETLSAVNDQKRFAGAAMAMCNEVATRWKCERVSLGILKGRYVRMRAMSHTENINRKMTLIQNIESAMEECLDQDVEVVYPSSDEATYVSRSATDLSTKHGPTALVSLPLRQEGEAVAVLTAERGSDSPFVLEEIESLRLTCDLCTARILNLDEQDRWFGAKAAAGVRKGLAKLVGAEHAWIKVAALAILAAIIFLVFAKGAFRVDGPFVFHATQRQVIPAPFDGYLKTVLVDPGDTVEAGKTVLATLETAELRLQLAAARAERVGALKQADAATRDGEPAQAQIARAQADKIAAQIDLLRRRVEQAQITSPISGQVLTEDLKRQIGAPVKTGQVLFEVAPIKFLRAELSVPEDLIAYVEVGQEGRLAAASYPGERIDFVVERINPVAEVVEKGNVFKVRVRLQDSHPWMRPGMEGMAKVSIGRRRHIWIWTRRFVNWVRMKLWL